MAIYAVTLLQPQQRTYQPKRQTLGCCLFGKRRTRADRLDKVGKLSLVLLLQCAGVGHAHDAPPPLLVLDMINTSAPVSMSMTVAHGLVHATEAGEMPTILGYEGCSGDALPPGRSCSGARLRAFSLNGQTILEKQIAVCRGASKRAMA